MSQSDTDKTLAAKERTEEARSFVRLVRAATRRKYTPEEKIHIVLEGFRREVTVNNLCRLEGIKPHCHYSWTMDPSASSGQDSWRPARRGSDPPRVLQKAPFWWRRGRVDLHRKHSLAVMLVATSWTRGTWHQSQPKMSLLKRR